MAILQISRITQRKGLYQDLPDPLAGAELGWAVAMPNWDSDVKDVADAVLRYGHLFVMIDTIKTAQQGQIKINMAKKQQEHKLERLENV